MNKNKISKIITLIITFSLVACISTTAFAENQIDLEALTGNTAGNNTTTNDNNTEGNTTDDDVPSLDNTINNPGTTPENTPGNTTTTPENTTPENTTQNNTTTTGNTSTYEESDIPYAGPAETILMTSAFIVFGIIGVYTFVKMSDYSNI